MPTTYIVPLYDPLRLAEEIAMLDHLSHGRLELGIGKGSSPHEAAMFGFAADDMRARYAASLPVLREALETGTLPAFGGRPPVELTIRPSGPLPLWYPTSNPASIRETALNGENTIFGFAFRSPDVHVIREHRDIFFETFSGADAPHFGVLRHVLVADTDAAAAEIAERAFADHYDNFTWLWRRMGVEQPPQPDLRDLVDRHLFLLGSPATVARQTAELVDATGVTYLAGAFAWGSLPREDALRSMDLFDTEVIPAVR